MAESTPETNPQGSTATEAGADPAAVAETARLTESVYGVAWGGGVYVNYTFVAIWAAYLSWWRRRMDLVIDSRRIPVLVLRCLLFVLIVNALVVFASPQTRALGVIICAVLLWAWRPGESRQELVASRSRATSTLRSRT